MKEYVYNIDLDGADAPALLLRAVGTDKKVLEVGCASGVQTRIMTEAQRCRITAIEIDAVAADKAKEFCDAVIVGDLESLNLMDRLGDLRFDVITIADVLEHLRDPAAVLQKLKPFVASDGYIVASIPNVVHAGLILDMAKGRFDYNPFGLLDDTHLRFFTLKSVCSLFENCGFHISNIERAKKRVSETEFFRHPLSPEEQAFVNFIRTNNPEYDTYQFVVTAKLGARMAPTASELSQRDEASELQHEIRYLKNQVHSISTESRVTIGKLESQLGWIESRRIYRFLSIFKRLFVPGKSST